jgi:hypothetical protein
MLKDVAAIGDVEGAGLGPVIDTQDPELDIGHALGRRALAREPDLDLVHVDAVDAAAGPDPAGQLEGHVPGSRAQVEGAHPRREPDPVQQCARRRGPEAGEHLEPFVADLATLDDVVLGALVHAAP